MADVAHMPLDAECAYAATGRMIPHKDGPKNPETNDRMDHPPPYIKDDPVVPAPEPND